MRNKFQIFVVILIIVGFAARLFPHPANFAPIGALAMFGGMYLPRRFAFVVPLIAMFLSDIIIGFYSFPILFSVYFSFMIVVGIGMIAKHNKKFYTILGGTLIGSIIFFLITNATVWAFGTMYEYSLAGLLQSYYMALPFFKNSLLSDIFYVSLLVGISEFTIYFLSNYKLHTYGPKKLW